MRQATTHSIASLIAAGLFLSCAHAQGTSSPTPPTTEDQTPLAQRPTQTPDAPPASPSPAEPQTTVDFPSHAVPEYPYGRWGGKIGILSVVGSVESPSNAIYPDGSWPFVAGGISYRFQSPGKRALFQPEAYMDMGANPAFSPPDSTPNAGFPEGHAYVGIGLAERTSLYIVGRTAVYFGAGGGLYETTSFHLENGDGAGSTDPQPYSAVADYSCARLGYKLFAGLQLHSGFFGEASYQDLGSADSYRYRGAALFFGYRR